MIVIVKVMSGEMFIGQYRLAELPIADDSKSIRLTRPKVFAMGMTREGGMAIQMPDLFAIISDDETVLLHGVEWIVEATKDIAENYEQSLSPIVVPPTKKLEMV